MTNPNESRTPPPSGDGLPEPAAYCAPDNPFNTSAFSWPGSDRRAAHTMALYTADQVQALLQSAQVGGGELPIDRGQDSIGKIVMEMSASHNAANRGWAERLRRLAQPQREGVARCSTCDGTGDVHRVDGEYMGRCHCVQGASMDGEDAAYQQWFDGEQGKPYAGMWEFGKAAWVARGQQPASAAVGVPDDFITHKDSWREALRLAMRRADTGEDKEYWFHEITAYDLAHAELDERANQQADKAGGES